MAIITKRRKAYSVIYQQFDENGNSKPVFETYYNYFDALARKKEIESNGADAKMNINQNTTIVCFLLQYSSKIGIKQWSVNRYENYVGAINNYISKAVGEKQIKDIDNKFAGETIKNLQKMPALGSRHRSKTEHIPPTMLRACFILLKSTFDYLVSENMIKENPFYEYQKLIPVPKSTTVKGEWNLDFVKHLFDNVFDIRLFIFLHIMFSAGLDIKEIGGLSWDDIYINDELIEKDQCYIDSNKVLKRLNKNTINLMDPEQIIEVFKCTGFNQTNTALTLLYKEVPKGKVHIHKQVAQLLLLWRQIQNEYIVKENPHNLLITLINGKPCDDRNMTKLFHQACSQANLHNLTLTKLKFFSKKMMEKEKMTNADFYYSTLSEPLTLPEKKNFTKNTRKLENNEVNKKFKKISNGFQNKEFYALLQQIKDNPELKMKLIKEIKAEL